ncbi:MAG: hypothetical protein KDA60_19285, partial [Planctomycetales bacterium]|nr:hypothetical protein [Planctomycetales bacterium]
AAAILLYLRHVGFPVDVVLRLLLGPGAVLGFAAVLMFPIVVVSKRNIAYWPLPILSLAWWAIWFILLCMYSPTYLWLTF